MAQAGGHPKHGGIAARRAVVRWAVRLFRREWRQQTLILTLLVVAVAAAVLGTSVAYAFASTREAEFGTAQARITIETDDADLRDERAEAARDWFGAVDVIDRMEVAVPGTTATDEVRAQDPDGRFGAPMLDLHSGRYPSGPEEIAVTDEFAALFGVDIGDELELDEGVWQVVGRVENPGDLHDEFGLVAPGTLPEANLRYLLVDGDFQQLRDWPMAEAPGLVEFFDERGQTEKVVAAVGALGVSAIAMLLVSLVATAGFVVVAQRRQRQIGLLAATGATDKHLRLVMVANGMVVGLVASSVGTAVGLAGWVLVAPRVEMSAGHRFGTFDMPWWVIALAAALAVVFSTVASWWPARAVARLPVTAALSGRPPAPRRARRTVVPALVLIAAGASAIVWADPTWYLGEEISRPNHDVALIGGVLAVAVGVLLACPLAVQLLGWLAGRMPVAPRLALRDLSRYRARSGAALAAISLALGIPVGIVITGSATAKQSDEGNLSDRQMLIRIGDVADIVAPFSTAVTADELERLQAAVDAFAAEALDDDTAVVPLAVPYDPELRAERPDAAEIETVDVGKAIEGGYRDQPLAVATPEMLAHYGVDPDDIPAGTDVLTTHREELAILGMAQPEGSDTRRAPAAEAMRLDIPDYSVAPTTLMTEETVERYELETTASGWLVESRRPLTVEQVAAAREVAVEVGLTIVTRADYSYATLFPLSVTLGMTLALAILGMTLGLIRSESTDELRTLAATGADSRIRRRLTASTAAALAFLGVLCGSFAAYLALASGYIRTPGLLLERMPVQELLTIAIGMPMLAAATGWVVGGREPASLIRPRLPMASIAVFLALALTAGAACGGDDDGGEGGSGNGGTVNPEDRDPLPLEEYENAILGDDEERLAQERRVEQRIADCMAARGFEYVPVEPPPWTGAGVSSGTPWSLPSDEFAEQYGYGLFTIDHSSLNDPNAAVVAAMSDSEQTAYNEALQGSSGDDVASSGPAEGEVAPEEDEAAEEEVEAAEPEMGCMDEAWQGEFEMALLTSEDFATLSEDIDALFEREQSDPRLEDAARGWADCMGSEDPGYADFEVPDDAVDSVSGRFFELAGHQDETVGMESWEVGSRKLHRMRGLDVSTLDPEIRGQLSEYEVAVAMADLGCRADYDEVLYEVSQEYEEEFVEENRAELERLSDAITAAREGS